MTDDDKKGRKTLSRLVTVLVDDMLAASDQEILREVTEAKCDPASTANELRTLFEKSLLKANKDRLRKARAELAAEHARIGAPKIVSIGNVRERLQRALAICPPNLKLTLAARNENELSDTDMLGMLQDLEELGVVPPDDENGGRS